ncbi:response regulator transcription factor [Actinophytocola sp.]|uniref:response regulator transcription factor n=1 Tax=Actinophytocola sp. TaxID=1872138 RepID=UPI002D33FEE1|nr:response regulator transcription factor [Actinophytocola sp.]HYQ63139.1 response regulator transcription factor [Actinophytocola sp.]
MAVEVGLASFTIAQPLRILIVADQPTDAETLARGLARYGHGAFTATDGATAIESHADAELVLLDLELPDIDGLEVCQRIRHASDIPIIAFTTGMLDRVLGLQSGADDCLDKPYEFRELLARIDAVMRRSRLRGLADYSADNSVSHNGSHDNGTLRTDRQTVSIGSLTIDTAYRQVRVRGRTVELTRKEFDLLHYLATNSDTVVTRRRLMAEVWGDQSSHAASTQASRTIDTHVSSLRGKLGETGWIRTVRGVGFRFDSGG